MGVGVGPEVSMESGREPTLPVDLPGAPGTSIAPRAQVTPFATPYPPPTVSGKTSTKGVVDGPNKLVNCQGFVEIDIE